MSQPLLTRLSRKAERANSVTCENARLPDGRAFQEPGLGPQGVSILFVQRSPQSAECRPVPGVDADAPRLAKLFTEGASQRGGAPFGAPRWRALPDARRRRLRTRRRP